MCGGGSVIVRVGCSAPGSGGTSRTFLQVNVQVEPSGTDELTEEENSDRDIVNETGSRAKEAKG